MEEQHWCALRNQLQTDALAVEELSVRLLVHNVEIRGVVPACTCITPFSDEIASAQPLLRDPFSQAGQRHPAGLQERTTIRGRQQHLRQGGLRAGQNLLPHGSAIFSKCGPVLPHNLLEHRLSCFGVSRRPTAGCQHSRFL